jgi:hypothetical protein
MLDTVDAGLARVRAEAEDEIPLPEGATSLHFMQAIYRDPRQPMTRRMKAATPRDTRLSQPVPQLPAGESKMPPFRRRL